MKLTKDMCEAIFADQDITTQRYICAFLAELQSAQTKHPIWPKDFIYAAAIVNEEAGELIRAAIQVTLENGRYYDMHKEAIQTAAMCLRFLNNAPEKKLK